MSKLVADEQQAENLNDNPQETVEKQTIKTIWNQDELTKLLGYSDPTNNQTTENSETNTSSQSPNIIAQSELFDDPRQQKTKHRFSNHPFSKVGIVAFAMFLLCAITGILMKGMTSGGPTRAPSIHATAPPSPKPEIENAPTADKLENGRLKASLAIDDQVRAVKAVEDSKKNQSKIKFNNQKSSKPHTQKVAKISPISPTKPSPQIVYRRPPRRNLPQPKPNLSFQKISQIKENIDPIAQLQAINRLGSYGSEQPPEEKPNENFKADTRKTLQNPQIIELNKPSQDSSLQQTQFLPEESKIINGTNNNTNIRVGSIIPGKLISPLVWVEQDTQNNSQPQKIVIATTKPVVKNNQTILPENTEIIATVASIQSGVVQLQATQLIFDSREYSVPAYAIAINADKGQPLIASKWNNKHGQTATDAKIFLLGSLAQVGNVLNQPRSQQFSSNSGLGGNTTFSSAQRGRGNLLGAVLSGGFSPLTQQILQRNQKSLQQKINSESKVWFLKADTKIELFINESFSLD